MSKLLLLLNQFADRLVAVTTNCATINICTCPNHFPSNGVAMTVFFVLVFLTHLNTDALYFRLHILFQK